MLSVFFFWEKACVFMRESPLRYASCAAPSALSVIFGSTPSKKEVLFCGERFIFKIPGKDALPKGAGGQGRMMAPSPLCFAFHPIPEGEEG